ncbi:MAG: hypothetical protein JRJ26_20235 [Deltaproteobacteria bacterium]|nr:hypothetical protein [Deltaproteobacteria bacterium]
MTFLEGIALLNQVSIERETIRKSAKRVERWVEERDYRAYEPFDGLSSPFRLLTFGNLFLDRLLMQVVRQSPWNLRPLFGIKPLVSTKGRGYMVRGYLTMFGITGDASYKSRARICLDWLIEHKSPKFDEFSWANHFDFASRGGRYSKHESIIVWTALIGHAFLDGYSILGDRRYLEIADSVCRWILNLPRERTESGTCLSYLMTEQSSIHTANMLGASFLARAAMFNDSDECRSVAAEAMKYSCTRQRPDGSWWYAEDPKYHWIDNFHTGYNLDSLKIYVESTGDDNYRGELERGFRFFVEHFFEPDGCPRYYHNRTQPIDSQCAAQAIETLAHFSENYPSALNLALKVANWWIREMQDPSGYFYYRKYPLIKAKAPMLHWSQAVTYRALAVLSEALGNNEVIFEQVEI